MVWIDLIVFFLLFALFIYVFATATISNLHKAYLAFHFFMMLWPFCQFAIKITKNTDLQLFYVKLSFVDMSLLATGWLFFTLFLTGQSLFLRKKIITLAIAAPALLVTLPVIFNPKALFVQPIAGSYIERTYGSLFWLTIMILISYAIISVSLMYKALVSSNAPRIKKQVKQVLKGMLVMTAFMLLDIMLNVVLSQTGNVIQGLTSFGILISAVFFIIAIHRDKVFDIVTIARKDIINTITLGILVLDDNEKIVEINQSLPPYIDLHIGDRFNVTAILPQEESANRCDLFIRAYHERPLEKLEIAVIYHNNDQCHLNIHVYPILVGDTLVGRIITFQDMSALRNLINETKLQNKILQERNKSLVTIQEELYQTNQKLEQMAITDSLTGCYNRNYLMQQLERDLIKNMKYQIPFSILILDIDFFKLINDNYGHLAGDEVICKTVEKINQSLRPNDILARFGGEEFIIYLPNTEPTQAQILAERIKSSVESNKMIIPNVTTSLSITISIGLLSNNTFTFGNSINCKSALNEMLQSVDKALYQAKREGRNRIVSTIR